MKRAKEVEGRKCPKCGRGDNQTKKGYNRSGTQRCYCNSCKYKYTMNPKSRAYPEETQQMAMRIYYSGASGRGVGKALNMSKANVYNWIKKNRWSVDKSEN